MEEEARLNSRLIKDLSEAEQHAIENCMQQASDRLTIAGISGIIFEANSELYGDAADFMQVYLNSLQDLNYVFRDSLHGRYMWEEDIVKKRDEMVKTTRELVVDTDMELSEDAKPVIEELAKMFEAIAELVKDPADRKRFEA